MIRLLLVDDSRLVRTVLRDLLEADPELEVVAEAENGLEAVERCEALRPDVVIMDVQMPVMGGLEAVERIMARCPTPVIILSATVNPGEVQSAFRAVRAGAFEALPKPDASAAPDTYATVAEDLRSRIKLYARVARRRGWASGVPAARRPARGSPISVRPDRLLALAASTGGPRTVQRLLHDLPRPFPCPLVLVQHISLGFTRGFAGWLERETGHSIRVVEGPVHMEPGTVYLAADGTHLGVRAGRAVPREGPPVNACRPSADVLFESVAREYGPRAVGVVLTGMGRDGAQGALALRRAGGKVLVQDEESSVIYGMPKAAIDVGAATRVVGLDDMAREILEALDRDPKPAGVTDGSA